MFDTTNNWIVTYMDTPHYQITMRSKKFVDKAAEKEYLEFINLCNSQGDTIETQEPTQGTKTEAEE